MVAQMAMSGSYHDVHHPASPSPPWPPLNTRDLEIRVLLAITTAVDYCSFTSIRKCTPLFRVAFKYNLVECIVGDHGFHLHSCLLGGSVMVVETESSVYGLLFDRGRGVTKSTRPIGNNGESTASRYASVGTRLEGVRRV